MPKSNIKKKLKQLNYIDKYKELKDNKMILWNVKGKKVDKSLSRWTKYKINKAYREYYEIGGKTGIYYPPRRKGETTIGYTRRINKIKKQSGIAKTDISGILFEREYVKNLRVKNDKLYIKDKKGGYTINSNFIEIDRIAFNIDPKKYLMELFEKEFVSKKYGELDTVSPIHSHWTGDGTFIDNWENLDMFSDTISNWAWQYGGAMQLLIDDPSADPRAVKGAVDKYDNFITGLFVERVTNRRKKK